MGARVRDHDGWVAYVGDAMKPVSVDILGTPHKIIWCKTAQEVDDGGRTLLDGQYDSWKSVIRIHDIERPMEDKLQTLWHEILHGLEKILHTGDLDDRVVDLLATGITYVMLHNDFDVKSWDITQKE